MKKILAIILIVMCLVSSASAERWTTLSIKYNSAAAVLGADQLNGEDVIVVSVLEQDDTYAFDFGSYAILFIFKGDDIQSISIRGKDDAAAGEFLSACMAVITTFGGIDMTAYGVLLYQFAKVRAGKEAPDAYAFGLDVFQVNEESGQFKYSFTYLNRDLSFAK